MPLNVLKITFYILDLGICYSLEFSTVGIFHNVGIFLGLLSPSSDIWNCIIVKINKMKMWESCLQWDKKLVCISIKCSYSSYDVCVASNAMKVRAKNSPAHRLKVYSFDGHFMEGTPFKSRPLTKYIKLSSGLPKYCIWKDMQSILYMHVNNDT